MGMKLTEIKAKVPSKNLECSVTLELFGETLQDDINFVGDGVVKSNYEDSVVINYQARMRRMMESGKSCDEIQAALQGTKPGVVVRTGGVNVVEAFLKQFMNATPERKAELFAKLESMAGK